MSEFVIKESLFKLRAKCLEFKPLRQLSLERNNSNSQNVILTNYEIFVERKNKFTTILDYVITHSSLSGTKGLNFTQR